MQLVRVDASNGIFDKIKQQWAGQCDEYGEQFDEYAAPSIAHAQEIADGKLCTDKYGIYTLVDDAQFELIGHFNLARLPRTAGVTLRVVWVLMAPKYDYADVTPDVLAHVSSGLLAETIMLSKGQTEPSMKAEHIKIHLTNIADRRFFAGAAYTLKGSRSLADVEIRGNWLHMTPVPGETVP